MAESMLGQRRRRWPGIETVMGAGRKTLTKINRFFSLASALLGFLAPGPAVHRIWRLGVR